MIIDSDKRGIIASWQANQSANATGILRGGNKDVSEVVDKIKNKTATVEEIQWLQSIAADGKGNIAFSSDGELIDMSYGVGQIATKDKDKTMDKFEKYLSYRENGNTFYLEYGANFYTEFMKAGGAEGAKAGTPEFLAFWNNASQYSDFAALQINFLYYNNYVPTKTVFTNYGYNIDNYSLGAKNLVYSTGVQYGAKNTNYLLKLDINNSKTNDGKLIMNGTNSQTFKNSLTDTKKTYVEQNFPTYVNGPKNNPNSESTKNKIINSLTKRWSRELKNANENDKK